MKLIKPPHLKKGDTVATVSHSWGGAGDAALIWRYELGKQRLQTQFGLEVVEMPTTLKGSQYVYDHPEERARDLMRAFEDNGIKAVFSCIGGDESIRLLPYINLDIIRKNPKIFMGYSDATTLHLMCARAGVSSFYGPSVLSELAENVQIYDYTAHWLHRVLFGTAAIGEIPPAREWTGDRLEWTVENKDVRKTMQKNEGYEFLQGRTVVRGRLFGGCMEVLEMAKGTSLWPDPRCMEGAILFFETSEDMPPPTFIEYWLRNYGSQGIIQKASAVIFGKPYQQRYYEEYKTAVMKIVSELKLFDLPIVFNMSFGHNQPMCILPYGALAKVDCVNKTFSILESGVI